MEIMGGSSGLAAFVGIAQSVHLWLNHVKNPGAPAGLVLAAKARLTFADIRSTGLPSEATASIGTE